jgi:molybdopterin molybdotransferase
LATVGKSTVKVAKNPKVMIVSTGDELVEISEIPKEYQIRRSNVHTLVSLLQKKNISADTSHITDNKNELKQKIEGFLSDYDVLLFSGAVSKGKFDFIPEVLDELGVEKLFHKVAQRPGKPFWFGIKATSSISGQDEKLTIERSRNEKGKNSTIVFAFPGNPISTFVSCVKYFYPWLDTSLGLKSKNENLAILANDITFKPSMTYFLQVKLEKRNGSIFAIPIAGKGSGDLANLVEVDAFLELPADKMEFKKGEAFPVIEYR